MTMTPPLRKFALSAHLTFSVGWIGAVVAYLGLGVAARTSQDAQTVRAAYLAMELTASFVIVPLAFATLLTGLVMSLGTKWGLFRHYWTLISLLLTMIATLVLLVETRTISYFADIAADPRTSSDELRALGSTLVHSVGGTVVLLVNMWLNVYKPRGLTPYGRRTLHEPRARSQSNTGVRPDHEPTLGTPRWVTLFGSIALVVLLLFVMLLLTRGPGGHGPGRHIPFGGSGGRTPPQVATDAHDTASTRARSGGMSSASPVCPARHNA
jgi:hypothetical protein